MASMPKINISRVKNINGTSKTTAKGTYETVSTSIPERISNAKLGVPKLIRQAGVGATAVVIGSASIGFAGKQVNGFLVNTGLKNQTTAQQINDLSKSYENWGKTMQDYYGYDPSQKGTVFGQVPMPYDVNHSLNLARNGISPLSGNMGSIGTNETPSLVKTATSLLGLIAIGGALFIGLKYANKKVAK